MYTWSDDDVEQLAEIGLALGVDPRDLVRIMCNESGCLPYAHSPGGAVGLIQFEPSTLLDEGWLHGTDAFAKLSVRQQLPYVQRYYAARKAAIDAAGGGVGALYVATFLPALLAHAADSTFVLCGRQGPFAWAYAANKSFDRDGRGYVTVGDMVAAADRAFAASETGLAIVARLDALFPQLGA